MSSPDTTEKPSTIARAMAENLTRAIIEAGDSVITLIRHGYPSASIREHVAVAEAIAWRRPVQ